MVMMIVLAAAIISAMNGVAERGGRVPGERRREAAADGPPYFSHNLTAALLAPANSPSMPFPNFGETHFPRFLDRWLTPNSRVIDGLGGLILRNLSLPLGRKSLGMTLIDRSA
jgi:hypothetical protein